jgi:hypothetical protein
MYRLATIWCFAWSIHEIGSLIRVNHTGKYLWMGLLLVVSVAIQGQSRDTAKPATTDRGQINGPTYSNTALGFSYQLPQGFLVNPDNLPLGHSILMVADKHNGTPPRERIVIGADTGKYSGTIADYVTHHAHSMEPYLPTVVLRDTYRLRIADQDFFRIDYQTTQDGKTVYQDFVCTRLKGALVSWTFASLNKQQVEEMATSINSVAFASAKAR